MAEDCVNDVESPMQTLLEKLEDFTVKYDALEHNYNTLKLESNEYQQHITELQQQNKDLTTQIDYYKSQLQEEDHLKPMMHLHISSMNSSLAVNDEELQQLSHRVHQYNRSILSLQSENIDMKKQNEKLETTFRRVVETNNKQKQTSKRLLFENNNQIKTLKAEIQSLRDELEIANATQVCCNCNKRGTPTPSPVHVATPSKDFFQMRYNRSIDEFPDTKILPRQINRCPSTDSIQFLSLTNSVNLNGKLQLSLLSEKTSINSSTDMDKMRMELERLNEENKKLIRQLNVYNNEEDDEKDDMNVKSDAANVMEEFNNDDINEMEQLFHKCMLQYWKKVNF